MGSKLDAVTEAAARGAYGEALGIALAAWRHTPDAAIADAIDGLSARALEKFEPPKARDKEEFQRAWLSVAAAANPVAVGWLARELRTRLPETVESAVPLRPNHLRSRYAAFFQRVEALARLGPDPRIAASAVALARLAPFSAHDPAVADTIYDPVLRLVLASPDRRQLEPLRDLLAAPRASRAATREYFAGALPALTAVLEFAADALAEGERAAWAQLAASAKPQRQGTALEKELLEAIYAHADDLDPRAVYADWLADQGDPRGEFISLQLDDLRRELTGAERSRSRKLLKAHQRDWLGVLAQTFRGIEFRAGFLDRAELAPNAVATAASWAEAAHSAQLATVRTLAIGQGSAANYARFLLSPHATGLRRAEVPSAEVLTQLLEGPPRRITHLGLRRIPLARSVDAADWKRVLPALETLDIEIPLSTGAHRWALGRLRGHPVLDGPRRLRVFSYSAGDEIVALRDAVSELLLPSGLESVDLRRHGCQACFWRSPRGLEVRIVDPRGHFWNLFVDQLPAVASLELVLPGVLPERSPEPELRAARLREAGVEVTILREPKDALDARVLGD